MSLDEALFAWAWRVTQALRRNTPPAAECPHAARLAELRPHLTLVARALSGAPLEIQDAEQTGGFIGEVLYLPQRISIATTLAENVNAYLYRVAYTVTSRQLGLTLAADGSQAPDFQAFCTLLAVPTTLQAVEATLPMTRAIREQLFPLYLGSRPPWPALETTATCLEALTQALLGRPLPAPATTPGWTWLRQSLTVASAGWSDGTGTDTLDDAAVLCAPDVCRWRAACGPVGATAAVPQRSQSSPRSGRRLDAGIIPDGHGTTGKTQRTRAPGGAGST